MDSDNDGLPDYRDTDSNDNGVEDNLVARGCGCAQPSDVGATVLFALALVLLRRRRATVFGGRAGLLW